MRRISILILTAMLLTISGVYATWNYAQGDVNAQDAFLLPSMTDKVIETAKGTITLDKTNAAIILDDANNDHVAELTYAEGASVLVTFTPSKGADPVVFTDGVTLVYSLTVTPNWTYPESGETAKQIFSVKNPGEKTTIAMTRSEVDGVVTFTGSIPVSDILAKLSFGGGTGFTLSNAASYDAFRTILNRGNIKITVEEYVAPAPLPSEN